MRFPYPLYPREYVFVRRFCVDPKERLLILVSRSLPELEFKRTAAENPSQTKESEHLDRSYEELNNQKAKSYVRITNYKSNIIVIPHSDFDKPGINYVIQYYDINKAQIPKVAYSWMAASGLPDFIDRLHDATIKLRRSKQKASENGGVFVEAKEELEKYDVIYLNEGKSDKKRGAASTPPPCRNNAKVDVSCEKEKAPVNQEENSKTQTTNKYEIYLENILEKLNSDFFSQNEPHEIFYNF